MPDRGVSIQHPSIKGWMGGAAVGLGPLLALRKVSFFQNSSDFFLTEEEIYNAGAVCLIPESELTPQRRKWQPTPVFSPGKSHGQKSLACYRPWGCKRARHNLVTTQHHVFYILE